MVLFQQLRSHSPIIAQKIGGRYKKEHPHLFMPCLNNSIFGFNVALEQEIFPSFEKHPLPGLRVSISQFS